MSAPPSVLPGRSNEEGTNGHCKFAGRIGFALV
jgi:hypothetical protein